MTLIKSKLVLLLLISSFSTLTGFNSLWAAETTQVGKTLLTRGKVISKRSGSDIIIKRRSKIFENDEIHVAKNGRAQFRMIDKALISLQENSVLQIKKYQYDVAGKPNSALMELLSGGLRTITGAIGKGNKQAYELRTPLATIGIRGTDYEVEIVSNGMYVAVWEGVIHLRARIKNRCNILLGKSQPFRFIFVDQLGRCNGFDDVPEVFRSGHSSNITPNKKKRRLPNHFIAGSTRLSNNPPIDPLLQLIQDGVPTLVPPVVTPPVNPPSVVVDHNALMVDQSQPAKELDAKSSVLGSPLPTFTVGLNSLESSNGIVENFKQSVAGYDVSWGYWGEFTSSLLPRNVTNSTSDGLIWASYNATDPTIISNRSGTFNYNNIVDSLLSGSNGSVNNLQVQMDVNFESGDVTNGALSANTAEETWVAVFDGKIDEGDLDLQLNGASVINSDPSTLSPPRDADGFIAGDFVGDNGEAILGAFGLSENGVSTPNHIEGVFIIEEK